MQTSTSFFKALGAGAMCTFALSACALPSTPSEEPRGEALQALDEPEAPDPCGGDPGIGNVGFGAVRAVAELERGAPNTLHLTVGLDDEVISARVQGYDGSRERVFACVPLRVGQYGTGPRFRKVELSWRGDAVASGRRLDVHAASIPVAEDFDAPNWSFRRGVYFGIETPVGIAWAQWPGEDAVVRTLQGERPTSVPVP
jgi:hypothetical protein